MRILFVLHQFFPEFSGGAERVALNMARMAQHAGHHVQVLASTVDIAKSGGCASDKVPQGCVELVYQGLPVTLIPTSLLPVTADISMDASDAVVERLVDWIESKRFDVAHVLHTMRMGSALLALQRFARLAALRCPLCSVTNRLFPALRQNQPDHHAQ